MIFSAGSSNLKSFSGSLKSAAKELARFNRFRIGVLGFFILFAAGPAFATIRYVNVGCVACGATTYTSITSAIAA